MPNKGEQHGASPDLENEEEGVYGLVPLVGVAQRGFLVFLVRFPHFYIAQYYFLGVVNQLQLALILLG